MTCYNYTMLAANKSSQVAYHPASKTLLLDFGPTNAFQPVNNRLFPHRIKKVQQPDANMHRKNKAIQLIEDFAQFHLVKERQSLAQSINRRFLEKSGKISAYLSYKKEQQVLKLQHYSKGNHQKSRSQCKREGEPRTRDIIQYCSQSMSPDSKRIGNMSKINMVLLPSSASSGRRTPEVKSRSFYMKTSEGKRQRVSSLDYQNRMRDRLLQSGENNRKDDLYSKFNEYSENNMVYTTHLIKNQSKPSESKPRSSYNGRQLRGSKNKSNSLLRARWEEQSVECRPWTSSNES